MELINQTFFFNVHVGGPVCSWVQTVLMWNIPGPLWCLVCLRELQSPATIPRNPT